MELDFATDGFEVIESFHKNKPDLILMDVSMPGKDGLEATREIRKFEEQNAWLSVPIYALTANAFSSQSERLHLCRDEWFSDKTRQKKMSLSAR